jgi:hypothetical protein
LEKKDKAIEGIRLRKLVETLTSFLLLKLEIYELKAKGQLVQIVSSIAIFTLILTFAMVMLFFFSLALGFYLNTLFDSRFIGFLLIGSFYLIGGALLVVFRDQLITNHIFEAFFSKTIISGNDDEQQEDS